MRKIKCIFTKGLLRLGLKQRWKRIFFETNSFKVKVTKPKKSYAKQKFTVHHFTGNPNRVGSNESDVCDNKLIQKASQPSLFDKVFVEDTNNHSKRQRNCRK